MSGEIHTYAIEQDKCPINSDLISFIGYLENLSQEPTLYLAIIKNLKDTYTPSRANNWSPPAISSFDLGNPPIPSPNGPLDEIALFAKHLLAKTALPDSQVQKILAPHGLLGPRVFPTNDESIAVLAAITPCNDSCATKPLPLAKAQHHAEATLLAQIASSPPPASRSPKLNPLQTAAIAYIMVESLAFRQATRFQSQPGTTLSYKSGSDIRSPSKRLIFEAGGQRVFTISGLLTREVEWTITETHNNTACRSQTASLAYIGSSSTPPTGSTISLDFQPPGEKIAEIWRRLSY